MPDQNHARLRRRWPAATALRARSGVCRLRSRSAPGASVFADGGRQETMDAPAAGFLPVAYAWGLLVVASARGVGE